MRPYFLAPVVAILIVLFAVPAKCVDWRAVDPAELQLREPKLDAAADAETLLWEVWVEDHLLGNQQPQMVVTNYIRVKVYTDKGVEEYGNVELTRSNIARLNDLRARTIKPDGTIASIDRAQIFETEAVRAGDLKVKTKSFAVPNLAPGDILEYQWRESYDDTFSHYERFRVQRDTPAWKIQYHIKPQDLSALGYRMSVQFFNAEQLPLQPEPQGYYGISYENVPAFKTEPNMPPEDHLRSWLMLFYTKHRENVPKKYWEEINKEYYKEDKRDIKVDNDIKEAAAGIVGDAASDTEKFQRIRTFCLTEITNVFQDRFSVSAEDRENREQNKKPSDTLKHKEGSSREVANLYAALLQAAGLEARLARVPGRDDSFFNPNFLDPYFLNRYNIAVKIDGQWQFSDLGNPYLEHGMLDWAEEGVQALISDPKEALFVPTPMSGPEKTVTRRKGDFTLDAAGTLEGTVTVEMTGHAGSARKGIDDGKSAEERGLDLKEQIEGRLPGAEITEIEIANVTDLEKPYTYSYRIRAPGYAMATGKRLVLQPAFFQRGVGPRFSTTERKHDVYFHYAWSESDEVTIQLPEGFVLEDAEAPQSIQFGPVGHYKVSLSRGNGTNVVQYTREFVFGNEGKLLFPVTTYAALKAAFDRHHNEDNHSVMLHRAD